jgi:hypothetical protein
VVKPADIGRQIHRGRTCRDEFIYQVREERFKDVLPTLQQGMSMDALRHAFANLYVGGSRVAFTDGYSCKMPCQRPGSEQAGHAAPNHHGMLS